MERVDDLINGVETGEDLMVWRELMISWCREG